MVAAHQSGRHQGGVKADADRRRVVIAAIVPAVLLSHQDQGRHGKIEMNLDPEEDVTLNGAKYSVAAISR
jgi:hypothetical protein